MVDSLLPLIIGLVGGPAALIFRILYGRKGKKSDKFSSGGTYNRNDDDFYLKSDKPASSNDEISNDEN